MCWFWDEEFWLRTSKTNVTWKDLVPTERNRYPNPTDQLWAIPLACFFYFGGLTLRSRVLEPLGRSLIPVGAKSVSVPKFGERLGFGVTMFFLIAWSLSVLDRKPWFWHVELTWRDYPFHPVDDDVRAMYLAFTALYISDSWTFVSDPQRRDSWDILPHHVAVLALLFLSWQGNLVRFGSLVFVVNGLTDWMMDLALACDQVGLRSTRNAVLLVLSLPWVLTRLLLLPWLILRGVAGIDTLTSAMCLGLLGFVALLAFNLYWSFKIFRILFRYYGNRRLQEKRLALSFVQAQLVRGILTRCRKIKFLDRIF